MPGRHLLGLRDLDIASIVQLLDAADEHINTELPVADALAATTVVTLFYEPSTRTELSFELAARRLGAEVVRCDVDRSSVKKGETLLDTGRTLEAMGVDAIVLRHPSAGAPHLLARAIRATVINAGDGMHEHPTQGLIDLLSVRQVLGRIAGLRVAIVGDITHSRVARSALWGFAKLGAQVRFVGPPTLLPSGLEDLGVETASSLEAGLAGADVVMALRMQLERQPGGDVPSLSEYTRLFGITRDVLRHLDPGVIVMHPGPINPGVEIETDVAYGPQSILTRQVANGVGVRMAVLEWAFERARTKRAVINRLAAPMATVSAAAD
jgi:aspartate carbamoyltransferase catalytic subunit